MSDTFKKLIDKAIEVAAGPVLSVESLTTVATEIKKKYGSFIVSSDVYQDKKTKMKMVIAVGKIEGVRFIYQINEDGSYVASINSKILETKGLSLTTVGAVLVTVNRVVERAKITAKAINAQDILKDKIVIGSKEEASVDVPASAFKTNKTAAEFVKTNFPGITLTYNSEDQEYVVKIKGKPKSDYFTNDREDAVLTARSMFMGSKLSKNSETASAPIKGTFTLNNNYFFFSVEGSSFRYSIISKDLYVDENSDTKKIKDDTTFDLAIMHATTYALNKKLDKKGTPKKGVGEYYAEAR